MTGKNLLNKCLLFPVLSLSLVCFMPTRAVAWGNNGHRIIARIAMDRLSKDTRQALSELLAPGETLESVSNWADTIKAQKPETRSWHFVDIPLSSSNYQKARDCRKGCIIEAIAGQTAVLKSTSNSPTDRANRAEALKFLIHLIGDLHQPFHVTTNTNPNDQGANLVKVIFMNGRPTSLHAVWDDDLINYTLSQNRLSVSDYAAQIANKFRRSSTGQSQATNLSTQGSVTDWAGEAHRLAWGAYVPSDSYFMINDNKVWKLDRTYYDRNLTVVESQLYKAGVRLAKVLNEVFSVKTPY